MSPRYPDDPTVGFSTPPVRFRDREGRPITIRAFDPERGRASSVSGRSGNDDKVGTRPGVDPETGGGSAGNTNIMDPPDRDPTAEAAQEALVDMYDAFDPGDRAQGIPPSGRNRIRDWLGTVLASDCYNVIAWDRGHDPERAAGHATLVPDDDAYELAIFVLQRYQEAGIGTRLLRALLGHGRARGVQRVWLSVERWNRAAIALYRKIGFETVEEGGFEQVMTLQLADESGEDESG